MIRKYRVWFLAFHGLSAVVIEGKTDAGIVFDAYNVQDVIEQAKTEIPYILKDHPLAPFHRIAIYKVAPEPVGELEAVSEPEREWSYRIVGAREGTYRMSEFEKALVDDWEPYLFGDGQVIMRRRSKKGD